MDFEQIRIFMMLVEEKTFLGAADRLGTSRSRVRRKLEQLELDAGTPLLIRERGDLTLTPAGGVLAERGGRLIRDAQLLVSHLRDIGNAPTGTLRVALPLGPPSDVVLESLATLQARFPQLEVTTVTGGRPAALLPDDADVAIDFDRRSAPACEVLELNEIPMRLFAGQAYLERHGRPESPEELSLDRLALWQADRTSEHVIHLGDGKRIDVEPRLTSNDPTLLCRLAHDADYLAYVPDLPHLLEDGLSALLVEEIRGAIHEQVVVPDIFADLPKVTAFVDLLQAAKTDALAPFLVS